MSSPPSSSPSSKSKKEVTEIPASIGTRLEDCLPSNIGDHDEASPHVILEAKPLEQTNTVSSKPHIPSVSASAVLGESTTLPESTPQCKGMEFHISSTTPSDSSNEPSILDTMMKAFATTGFQATNLATAVERIQELRKWRLDHVPFNPDMDDASLQDPQIRKRIRARIFLAYTSNQISCGQREVLRFLVQHKMVDVIVTTAGGIEEDIIKCFHPTFMGDFKLNGSELRKKGINRIGNLLIPNKNYCDFEDWLTPLLEKMHQEQDDQWAQWAKDLVEQQQKQNDPNNDDPPPDKFVWTPSKMIHRLGKEIDNEESVLYWAAKNDIPIFCPALTDGSVGDMLYFHSYKRPGMVLDIAEDIRKINDLAVRSHCTGQIILGGGLVKHHTCNANLMRNGADYSVYVNTGAEFDGSDSGASPDEAVSWGKIRLTAKPVKVTCDASIAFPLIVSQTFAKNVDEWKKSGDGTVCHVDDLDN